MIRAKTIDAAEEKELLQEWFDTVQFDEESEGLPKLEDEVDDEERSASIKGSRFDDVDMDELLEELRKRDPENPF